MNRVLIGVLFALLLSSPAWAQSQAIESLKDEVQALKQTVQELKNVVELQNQRINQLEGKKQAPPSSTTPSSVETTETQLATPTETPSESTTAYRQMGFWKVPVNPTGPSRFIPNISVNGIFALAYFNNDPGEMGHNPSRTGFNLQEIEVAIQSVIDPYVRADIFLAFSEEGVEIEEAYMTTLSLPRGMQIKAGKYLLSFGRQNVKHVEQWPFVNDNLVNQRLLGDEGFNELGIEISYLFPTPFFLQLQGNWTQGTSEDNFDGDRKGDFAYTGRLSGSTNLTENLTLLAGASGAYGFNNTGSGNSTILIGGDLLLKWQPSKRTSIEWQTEYIYRRREIEDGVDKEDGLYSYLLGNWSQRWGAGFRFGYLGVPSTVQAYRLSPMVVFKPTEFLQVKLQYDFLHERDMEDQHAAFLQWIFTMGPHGPHPF